MEKRIIGIILTILGVAGLLYAGFKFMNGEGGGQVTKQIVMFGILGAIFFFSGIGLIKNTKDRPT